MLIRRLMTRNPATVGPGETLDAVRKLMERGKFRRVPVVEDGRVIGIITDRDIRRHVGYLASTKINAVMTPDPMTVTSSQTVEDAARLMVAHKIGGLPVVEEGNLVGIVTTTDVLQAFLRVERATQSLLDDC